MIFLVLYFISFFMIINSDDWFLIWIGLEFNMLSFIILIYRYNSLTYIESCMKYFFVQSLGSAMLMGGFYVIENNFLYFSVIILSYKMGSGPFFFWFPSVCSGLGWGSCFFLMTVQKFIPLMLMMFFVSWIIWFLIVFSLFIGAVGSLNQSEMKRLMAFSSIHHSGWMMICIMIDSSLCLLYLLMYMFVIGPFFFMMSFYEVNSINHLSKWKSKWWISMCMFSMAGMPPFLGFFLKWISFFFIMKMDYTFIFFMIFMSIIMFYIYVRIVYDLLLGIGNEISWFYKKEKSFYFFSLDIFAVFGSLMGGFIVLIYLL